MSKKMKQKPPSLIESYDFMPLLIAMAIVPLLIQIVPVTYNTADIYWLNHQGTFYDFFSYFKSQVIIFLGLVSLIPIGLKIKQAPKAFYKDKIILISAAAMGIVILSSVFAKVPYVSFRGYVERYESIFVILSYWLFFILAYKIDWSSKKLNWMFNGFWITNILLSLLGMGQYLGFDLLLTEWFKPLITSFKMSGTEFSTDFIVNYKVIGQTLYHYNYVAFFITLSLPIFLTKFLYEKKWLFKIAYLTTSGLILFNLLGSTARGGLLGVLVALIFWILFNWRILFKNLKVTVVIALLLVVGFIGFESLSDGFVTRRILSTFDTPRTEYALKSLYTEGNTIVLETKDGDLAIQSRTDNLAQFDLDMTFNENPISFKEVNEMNQGIFEEDVLKDITIYPAIDEQNEYYLALEVQGNRSLFALEEGNFLYHYSNGSRFALPEVPSIGFDGLERLGSGRGYIWSRTLPLIQEKPILGYGVDNYAIAFPQHDFIGKLNTYRTYNMIVDKAHNLYLQYAISSGLIYLLLYLTLLVIIVVKAVPYLFSQKDQKYRSYVIALLTALIGFHVAGYFNDSSVHVAPVFWVMFGMTYGLLGDRD